MKNITEQQRWVRLPKAGQCCPHTGLSRSSLYLLAKRGDVESRIIYPTANGKRGVLLIKLASLMEFLDGQASAAISDCLVDANPHQQGREVIHKDSSKKNQGGQQS